MTGKAVMLHHFTRETLQGQKRMAELKPYPFSRAFRGSFRVLGQMLKNRPLMLVLGIMSCVMVTRSATENFWPLLVTGGLGIQEEVLPLLSTLKSLVMLACFFLLSHRIRPALYFRPMRVGLTISLGLYLMLLALPRKLAWAVVPGVIAEALALSILMPLFSSLQMLLLDPGERAKMFGLSLSFCLLVTSPFGTLNGLLSRLHLALPMLKKCLPPEALNPQS
jgi:Na+/melibiose symporter-like transporter